MSRFFKKTTLDEFKKIIDPIINVDEESDEETFPYNMPESIGKDLKNVSFDFENYEIGNAYKNFNPKYERKKTDRHSRRRVRGHLRRALHSARLRRFG